MGVMKSLFSGKQMSEAFICSAFLALSGGFQDAYTYNTRNEVFSNAQTGNVVLMSQNFMTGKWEAGLKYLFPLFAFALGVLIAEQIQSENDKKEIKRLDTENRELLLNKARLESSLEESLLGKIEDEDTSEKDETEQEDTAD